MSGEKVIEIYSDDQIEIRDNNDAYSKENGNFLGIVVDRNDESEEVKVETPTIDVSKLKTQQCRCTVSPPIVGSEDAMKVDMASGLVDAKWWTWFKKCEYCGKRFVAKIAVLDPNKFPANKIDEVWLVCEDCKVLIEKQMVSSMKVRAKELVDSGKQIIVDSDDEETCCAECASFDDLSEDGHGYLCAETLAPIAEPKKMVCQYFDRLIQTVTIGKDMTAKEAMEIFDQQIFK